MCDTPFTPDLSSRVTVFAHIRFTRERVFPPGTRKIPFPSCPVGDGTGACSSSRIFSGIRTASAEEDWPRNCVEDWYICRRIGSKDGNTKWCSRLPIKRQVVEISIGEFIFGKLRASAYGFYSIFRTFVHFYPLVANLGFRIT